MRTSPLRRSGVDHTVLPANTPHLPLPRSSVVQNMLFKTRLRPIAASSEKSPQFVHDKLLQDNDDYTGWRKKRGHPISLQIFWKLRDRIAWKLVNFCNIIMLNTVINILLKNFIALWRHLAKTQLQCDAQIYLYNVNKRQYSCVFARWRHSAMKWNF